MIDPGVCLPSSPNAEHDLARVWLALCYNVSCSVHALFRWTLESGLCMLTEDNECPTKWRRGYDGAELNAESSPPGCCCAQGLTEETTQHGPLLATHPSTAAEAAMVAPEGQCLRWFRLVTRRSHQQRGSGPYGPGRYQLTAPHIACIAHSITDCTLHRLLGSQVGLARGSGSLTAHLSLVSGPCVAGSGGSFGYVGLALPTLTGSIAPLSRDPVGLQVPIFHTLRSAHSTDS